MLSRRSPLFLENWSDEFHLGLLVGLRDRLTGIPSACDPELSTTSIVEMLLSGWINRCINR
jgi:hypothetical protein